MCALCDNKDKWFPEGEFGIPDVSIFTKDNILRMYNQGGFDYVEFKCKFCPLCGKKLEETK